MRKLWVVLSLVLLCSMVSGLAVAYDEDELDKIVRAATGDFLLELDEETLHGVMVNTNGAHITIDGKGHAFSAFPSNGVFTIKDCVIRARNPETPDALGHMLIVSFPKELEEITGEKNVLEVTLAEDVILEPSAEIEADAFILPPISITPYTDIYFENNALSSSEGISVVVDVRFMDDSQGKVVISGNHAQPVTYAILALGYFEFAVDGREEMLGYIELADHLGMKDIQGSEKDAGYALTFTIFNK